MPRKKLPARQWFYQIFAKYPELGDFYRKESKNILTNSEKVKKAQTFAQTHVKRAKEEELRELKKQVLASYKELQTQAAIKNEKI